MSEGIVRDVTVRAWSALTGGSSITYWLGKEEGNSPLSPSLRSHVERFGIAGSSSFIQAPLLKTPPTYSSEDSRTLRILRTVIEPLRPSLAALRSEFQPSRIAVIVGSSTGGIDRTETALREERDTGKLPTSYDFDRAHSYESLVRYLCTEFGLSGPSYVISTACTSSAKALASAQRLLTNETVDAVLVGGVDALCELTVRGFAGLGILAENGCKPFSSSRSGISIGEGGAFLILTRGGEEPFSLRGVGESNDAHHATAPHPEGIGARLAIARALTLARSRREDVVYVNAHGTATPANDAMESLAIASELGPVPYSSTKDRTGHLLGAAAALEAVVCLEGIRTGSFPENGGADELDSTLPHPPITSELHAALDDGSVVLSNSFAFGGNNVAVALGRTARSPLSASRSYRVFVKAMSLYGDGFSSLAAFKHGVRQESLGIAPALSLPTRVRGRASALCRLLAQLNEELESTTTGKDVPLFTGTAFGEMSVTLDLLGQLGDAPALSPAKFQSSVHNASAGLLTLLSENRSFSTAISCGRSTFATTLFDAREWLRIHGGEARVLVGDADSPSRLLPDGGGYLDFGVGLHLVAANVPPDDCYGEVGEVRRVLCAPPEKMRARTNLHEGALAFVRFLATDSSHAAVKLSREYEVELASFGKN